MKLFIKYISIVLAIYLMSFIFNSVYIGSLGALLIMGMVLLLVNLIIKPFLMLITLPANLLTLGLFSFIVNAWTIMIADSLVENISMGGFLNSLIAAFIITILNNLFQDKSMTGIHEYGFRSCFYCFLIFDALPVKRFINICFFRQCHILHSPTVEFLKSGPVHNISDMFLSAGSCGINVFCHIIICV